MLHHIQQNQSVALGNISWKVLPHVAYSQDLAPEDYHCFASMGHILAEQRSSSYEDIKNGLMNGLWQKGKIFTNMVFIYCPKDGKNV